MSSIFLPSKVNSASETIVQNTNRCRIPPASVEVSLLRLEATRAMLRGHFRRERIDVQSIAFDSAEELLRVFPGTCLNLTRILPNCADVLFQTVEAKQRCFDCRRSLLLCVSCARQGLFGDAAHLMEQLTNLGFEPIAAFLYPIEDIVLHPRAVDFK